MTRSPARWSVTAAVASRISSRWRFQGPCAALPLAWSLGLDLEIGNYVWLSSMANFLAGALVVLTMSSRVPA